MTSEEEQSKAEEPEREEQAAASTSTPLTVTVTATKETPPTPALNTSTAPSTSVSPSPGSGPDAPQNDASQISSSGPGQVQVQVQDQITLDSDANTAVVVTNDADEKRSKKIAALTARNKALEAQIATTREKLDAITGTLKQPAKQTVKEHIRLLHKYNEIRDVGQGLLGMIADQRGVRIRDVYEEFGVGGED